MVEYNEVNAKLSDSQLNELKTTVKNRQGLTLRINIKTLSRSNLLHKLLLTTATCNMSTDIKLPKTQIFQIIQSGRFLGLLLN